MTHGFREGLLRLTHGIEALAGSRFGIHRRPNDANDEALNEHDLRDLGMRDGRISPSTVERVVRPDAWDIIDRAPRWL
jgi:hypothetical protein